MTETREKKHNVKKNEIMILDLPLLMYRICSVWPFETPQRPRITLSDEEALALAPESSALARMVESQVVIRTSHIRQNIIWKNRMSKHDRKKRTGGKK